MSDSAPRWLPLESNPDIMTKFLNDIGMPEDWAVTDIIGFDPELLAFVPQPVAAVILLFPTSTADNSDQDGNETDGVYFMKQTIRNACGTIALLHALGNNLGRIDLQENSALKKFFDMTLNMSPQEKGTYLENDASICQNHESNALEGQTSAPNLADEVDYHFVALVERGGRIYILDGRKNGPIDEGPSSPDTFLMDAGKVCQKFMAKNPECVNFTAVALAKNAM